MNATAHITPVPEAVLLDENPRALPGPVIREEPVTARNAPALPEPLRTCHQWAVAAGIEVKLVTCRLPGTPVRADGSHEVSLLVPRRWNVPVAGTTL